MKRGGRGIQKIFESCNDLGSPAPEYKQLGDDLTVKFIASKVESSQSSKSPKHQNEALDEALNEALENKIIAEIKNDPNIKQDDLIKILNTSRSSIQRSMKNLQTSGRVQRVGGKRFWALGDFIKHCSVS